MTIERARIYLWAVAAFVLSEILAARLGIRFASETLGTLYQYLDPEILHRDLGSGLWYLHSQPPLFNLALGAGLKLAPSSYDVFFSFVFGALALGTLLGTAWLMRRLAVPDAVAAVALLLFALSPSFPVYRYWLFYTLPVAFLLVCSAIALSLAVDRGSRVAFAGLALCLTAIPLIRSVYHPLWLVVVGVALVPFVRSRRRFAVAVLIPFVIVNLWFLKNEVVVGSYAGSTWLGLSMTKRWPLSQEEVSSLHTEGRIPPYWSRRPFQEPAFFRPYGFFGDNDEGHPALVAPYKSNGAPNFNHRDYISISYALLEADIGLIRDYPGRYFRRIVTAGMLFLQPGPNSVHFLVDYDFDRVHRYRDAWTRYLFWGGSIVRPIRMFAPPLNTAMVLFPVLLVVAALVSPRPLSLYMLLTIVWVTAVANLIEIGENDRMRWEVQPFLVVLTAVAAARGLALLRRLKRA